VLRLLVSGAIEGEARFDVAESLFDVGVMGEPVGTEMASGRDAADVALRVLELIGELA